MRAASQTSNARSQAGHLGPFRLTMIQLMLGLAFRCLGPFNYLLFSRWRAWVRRRGSEAASVVFLTRRAASHSIRSPRR